MNIKILHGRLVRDPEYTEKPEESKSFAKWTVATDRSYGDGADFHDCIIFGKRAGVIAKFFHKGSEIVCLGEERHEPYTAKDGTKRKSVTLFVDKFDFCGSKSDNGKASAKAEIPDSFEEAEGDIPF